MKTSFVAYRTLVVATVAVAVALLAVPASAQDVLYVVNNKVGIGNSNPAERLHITAPTTADRTRIQLDGGTDADLLFYHESTLAGRLRAAMLNSYGNRYFGFLAYVDKDSAKLPIRFFTTNAAGTLTDALWIGAGASQGWLGVGRTTAPAYPIHVSNGAYCSAGGVWTDGSSREYKESIRDLTADEAAATLAELEPVTFKYKAEASDRSAGFIAEDVPDLVASPDRKGVAPMDVVAVLTRVVQEQQKTIDELKAKVDAIEKQR